MAIIPKPQASGILERLPYLLNHPLGDLGRLVAIICPNEYIYILLTTVHGRNPAPPGMYKLPINWLAGFLPSTVYHVINQARINARFSEIHPLVFNGKKFGAGTRVSFCDRGKMPKRNFLAWRFTNSHRNNFCHQFVNKTYPPVN